MGFKITQPSNPPFIMTPDMKRDVCVLVSSLPSNLQPLVSPTEIVLGFNKQKYIPTSYANELGFYPVSGSNSGSGGPESGYYTINSGEESGSGSGFASTIKEVHDRHNQNLNSRLRK
jgi:hypothetical protein